jgi:hypothetical protein
VKTLFSADAVQTADGAPGDAVLVEAGYVVAIGRRTDLVGQADGEQHYGGATIIGGLRDAHLHPVGYAAALTGTTVSHVADLAELGAVLDAASARLAAGVALVATRFDDAGVAERRLPTRHDLDAATGGRPTLVHRYCGHVGIANTAALRVAGIDAGTADPEGGSIDRDPDGIPTGVLRETAITLVSTHLDAVVKPSSPDLLDAVTRLAGRGLTSIGAMLGLGDGPWASLGDEVESMVAVADELPIHVHALVIANSPDDLLDARTRIESTGPRLRWAGLKLFADGSFGGHTAAMNAPFSDAPGETGTLRLRDGDDALIDTALAAGGMVAIHAIGDRANAEVLDRFEALVATGIAPGRLRLEHASVLTAADIDRIGRLGITVSVQPAFLGSETSWLADRMGPERLPFTYPFASLAATGVTLAGGSDSPVESPDPFAGMALARDRGGVVPDEALDGSTALRLFTDGAAAALGEPTPLTMGAPADLVVVDRNPVEVTPDELRQTEVLATVVDGVEVAADRSRPLFVA